MRFCPTISPWQTVYHYWRQWRIEDRWEQILDYLCQQVSYTVLAQVIGDPGTQGFGVLQKSGPFSTHRDVGERLVYNRQHLLEPPVPGSDTDLHPSTLWPVSVARFKGSVLGDLVVQSQSAQAFTTLLT